MNKSADLSRAFREIFRCDPKWIEWFMHDVYNEKELQVATWDSQVGSMMLCTPYKIDYQGLMLDCDYISCVATFPAHRGKGLMGNLMRETLKTRSQRGTAFAALIPASRPLYFIYDRLGFATVFYTDEERYTALHQFEKGEYNKCEPTYEIFRRLEDKRPGSVRHTELQYIQAVNDAKLSGGFVVAVEHENGSRAIAFVQDGQEIKVTDILADDEQAREAVLSRARELCGEKPIIIFAEPNDDLVCLRSRAMIRVVNADVVLNAVAEVNPKLTMTVRVRDSFIEENRGYYQLKQGQCVKLDGVPTKVDLDVTVGVLAKILFSTPSIGSLFNIKSRRPFISLMLD